MNLLDRFFTRTVPAVCPWRELVSDVTWEKLLGRLNETRNLWLNRKMYIYALIVLPKSNFVLTICKV